MGLAASQARFLAITARKADCEFQSMSIAQEKLSITRQLSQASSDYEDALDSTKLVWDYDDDTTYDLTYDILMSPSELNGYTPYLLTNAKGQIVLDTQLAAAADAAKLDPSGGTTGSLAGRNEFVQALANVGYISGSTAATIIGDEETGSVEWSAFAGFGGDTLDKSAASAVTLGTLMSYYEQVEELSASQAAVSDYADLYTALKNLSSVFATVLNDDGEADDGTTTGESNTSLYINGTTADDNDELSITSLFDDDIVMKMSSIIKSDFTDLLTALLSSDIISSPESYLDAYSNTVSELVSSIVEDGSDQNSLAEFVAVFANIVNVFKETLCADEDTETLQAFEFAVMNTIVNLSSYTASDDHGGKVSMAEDQNGGCCGNDTYISLSNIASMFLTNYAIALDGYSSGYYIGETASDSYYVTDDSSYYYIINNEDSYYDEKDLMIADYINVLYNQICAYGWTTCEGGDLNDSDFLQSAIKSGKYFISSLADDGYYYQSGYTSNGCITEVTDEDAIALAEAEYDRIKTDLNYKEETLDLEMQNLDLEISSLTTEYDTIKSMISKNIEKVFTMFSS